MTRFRWLDLALVFGLLFFAISIYKNLGNVWNTREDHFVATAWGALSGMSTYGFFFSDWGWWSGAGILAGAFILLRSIRDPSFNTLMSEEVERQGRPGRGD